MACYRIRLFCSPAPARSQPTAHETHAHRTASRPTPCERNAGELGLRRRAGDERQTARHALAAGVERRSLCLPHALASSPSGRAERNDRSPWRLRSGTLCHCSRGELVGYVNVNVSVMTPTRCLVASHTPPDGRRQNVGSGVVESHQRCLSAPAYACSAPVPLLSSSLVALQGARQGLSWANGDNALLYIMWLGHSTCYGLSWRRRSASRRA